MGLKPIPIHNDASPTQDNHSPLVNPSPSHSTSLNRPTNIHYPHLPEDSKSLTSTSSHYQSTHQQKFTFAKSLSSLNSDQAIHPNTSHQPKNLKRKGINDELATFAKRLRKATTGPESIYFDPDTATLIPQSRLGSFILQESQKAEDKARSSKCFSQWHPFTNSAPSSDCESFPTMAEEAGLTMPPPFQ